MDHIDIDAVKALIERVASRPENDNPKALWPCILINAFTSGNYGSLAPLIYTRSLQPHANSPEARHIILRRVKESLLKGTLLFGIPRVLNAFFPLSKVISEDDNAGARVETEDERRGSNFLSDEVVERGLKYMRNIYRDDADRLLEPMDRFWPDLRTQTLNLEYGPYLSNTTILSPIETSMITIASLMPLDVPTQVKWHMRGLLRNGGTEEQVREALDLCEEACKVLGVELKGGVPGLGELQGSLMEILRHDP